MRLHRGDIIEGLPALAARKLMRAYGDGHGILPAMEILRLNQRDAKSMLSKLCGAGYMEINETLGVTQWVTTIKGNALGNASLRTVKRQTAESQLHALIDRARVYNADQSKLHTVSSLSVFGSYLDTEQQELGDLDVAVVIVRRYDGEEYQKRARDFTRLTSRNFNSFLERLYWPEKELLLTLKNRVQCLSLTTEDITRFTDRYLYVYRVDEDTSAIQPRLYAALTEGHHE